MKFRRHLISDEVFAALAAGGGGAGVVRQLATFEFSKRLLLLRGVVERAAAIGHPAAGRAAAAYDTLAALQDGAPKAVEDVLRYPAVGAWLRDTLLTLDHDPARARPDHLTAVTAAAAVRARAPLSIEVRPIRGALLLPSLGEALVPADRVTVRSTSQGAEVVAGDVRVPIPADPTRDAPGWRGVRRLTASAHGRTLDLVLDDVDPYRMPADVADRLPANELQSWRAALEEAWAILTAHHPVTAAEIEVAHRVVTPLRPPADGQVVSGTAAETFGTVGLSAPADGLALAATLAHEVQHAKLGALLNVVRLTEPDENRRFYAPWREDPRPVDGLLQGAYAYLGVSGFWRRQRTREHGDEAFHAHREFARWRAGAHRAVDTLTASGLLTPEGKHFTFHMRRILAGWTYEKVPPAAAARAREEVECHLARWRQANAGLRP